MREESNLAMKVLLERGDQKRLAAEIGVSQGHLSRLLRGERGRSWKTAIAVAEKLGVSLDVLFGREQTKSQAAPILIRSAPRSGRDRREPLRELFSGLDENGLNRLRRGDFSRVKQKLLEVVREELVEKGA